MWTDPGLIFNALVAALLVAVIVFAALLNRRLKAWRADSGEMERLIVAFNGAVARAETALAGLRQAAREDGQALDLAQKRAVALRDDLAYLVERGTTLADRLEEAVRGGLAQAPADPAPAPVKPTEPQRPAAAPKPDAAPKAGARTMSDAEKRLIAALETMK